MQNLSLCIRKAHVVAPGRDLGVADVRVGDDGRIAAVGGADAAPRSGDEIVDADGLTLLPGFVDIHSHGRGGFDFSDATDEAFATLERLDVIEPEADWKQPLEGAYGRWKQELNNSLK